MYKVMVDCVSVQELKDIANKTGVDVWGGIEFASLEEAGRFAWKLQAIAPLATVLIK